MNAIPKPTRWRSAKYLKWVREQPCIVCEYPEAEPHHLIGRGHMHGMGLKAPDLTAIPLCRTCHEEMHDTPSHWVFQWEYIVRTLARAIEEGILKVR